MWRHFVPVFLAEKPPLFYAPLFLRPTGVGFVENPVSAAKGEEPPYFFPRGEFDRHKAGVLIIERGVNRLVTPKFGGTR